MQVLIAYTPSRASTLCKQGACLVRAAVPGQPSPLAYKRRVSMDAAATRGQTLRGHGEKGWADAWDLDKRTLSEELQRLVLTYGELAQATYDNVGTDPCDATFGYCVKQPGELLTYLTDQTPLAPNAPEPTPKLVGTGDRYKLPAVCDDGLSPLIHARPGKSSGNIAPVLRGKWGVLEAATDKVFQTVAGVAVTLVDGSNGGRRLFVPDPETGRGVQKRGAFIGYVAVSKPEGEAKEVDVAIVWRGTIFKEEWESNFAQDKLTEWLPDPSAKADSLEPEQRGAAGDGSDHYKAPDPTQVGVHDGFDDLYNRRIDQPVYTERLRAAKGVTARDSTEGMLSPREVLRMWLLRLFKEHNVTTVTSTGHSLGGALATISAFGVADLLEQQWEGWDKAGWKTQAKPKVSLFSFASPRVGNYTFGQRFREMGVAAMRLVNKGDVVPDVPGVVVQGLSRVVEAVPVLGKRAAIDMDSGLVQACQKLYYNISRLTSKVYPDKYGYFHVGQVLALDVDDAKDTVKGDIGFGNKHNLELYMHLVSRLGQPAMQRNPLLMNKSSDLWTNTDAPADWWGAVTPAPKYRNCKLQPAGPAGRWTAPKAVSADDD